MARDRAAEEVKPYLLTTAFQEQHDGPPSEPQSGRVGCREPSPKQIRAMCAEIRRCWSDAERVSRGGGVVPRSLWSEATHVPHGISPEVMGLEKCQDKFSCIGG
jgi:hypothetical protein